jgi:hypothetical protein
VLPLAASVLPSHGESQLLSALLSPPPGRPVTHPAPPLGSAQAGAGGGSWHGVSHHGWGHPRGLAPTASPTPSSAAPSTVAANGAVVRLVYGLVLLLLIAASLLTLLVARLDVDATACAPATAGPVPPALLAASSSASATTAAAVPLGEVTEAGHGRSILERAPPARVPGGLSIAVLTMYVRGEDPRGPNNQTQVVNYADKTADVGDLALRNMRAYCDYHGYDLLVIDRSLDPARPLVWSKLVALMRYLPDYDWILYMDGDALFANFSITIEDRLRVPDGGAHCHRADGRVRPNEFLVAGHAVANDSLNSGVMLLQNTPRVMDLLLALYGTHSRTWRGLQDNRAVTMLLAPDTAPDIVCRLRGDYSRWLQSSVHTTALDAAGNYVPGDWIVHFAGPCAPWCRIAAQLTNLCATYPRLPECVTALTRIGWQPMSPYGKILDPSRRV